MLKLLGARVLGFRPELVLAAIVVNGAYQVFGVDCIIRYGVDGTHMRGSEHYTGLAFDVRIHNVPKDKRRLLVELIRASLGDDYDVVWESQGTDNEHLHVEFDPKRPY